MVELNFAMASFSWWVGKRRFRRVVGWGNLLSAPDSFDSPLLLLQE